jgi:hypothetical protein
LHLVRKKIFHALAVAVAVRCGDFWVQCYWFEQSDRNPTALSLKILPNFAKITILAP